jgi:RND family efflux transporter MFP subunit
MIRAVRCLCLAVVAGALLAGCQRDSAVSAAAQSRPAPQAAPAPRPVKVAPARSETVARSVEAIGTLAADEQVVLGTKVTGRLREIAVDLGSRVQKGQPLGRIDPSDYQYRLDQAVASLQQARARLGLTPDGADDRVDVDATSVVRQARAVLDEAKLTRDRMARLSEQELVARAQYDSAVAALQVAEGKYQDALEEVRNRQALLVQRRAEVELARQQLRDTALVSPIDGAVSQRHASVGEYLGAGAPVVTLVRVHPLRLRLSVPEREAASVKTGQRVNLTVEGDSATYHGTVVRLSPALAEQNRTLLVEAEVPNPRGALRPGSFAKAQIVVATDQAIVTVPISSVVVFAGLEKVLSVADGRAVEVRVQTGRRLGSRVEVVAGLAAGQPVVVEPGNLAGGQPVTVER